MFQTCPRSIPNLSQIYPGFSGKQAILFPRFGIDLGKARFTSVYHGFFKRLLGVRASTPTLEVLAEVGRFPL